MVIFFRGPNLLKTKMQGGIPQSKNKSQIGTAVPLLPYSSISPTLKRPIIVSPTEGLNISGRTLVPSSRVNSNVELLGL